MDNDSAFETGGYTGFLGNSKINGKRHYHYKTKDITRYTFPKKTSGEFFVTLLNHNDTDVSLDKAYLDVSSLLLKSGTWTVPKTGNYEVYGIAAGGMWAGDGGIAYISSKNGKISKSNRGEDSLAQSGFGKGENGYNSGSSIMPKNFGAGGNGVIKITII
ncbi:hypothetical protein [Candidatus Marithrix sp. Canyon 246]|uniref:hypothetical protein n=1 Tax=Candidatus Marithrix sp. Canyon 246 TaxID=1827136 RepID=UPI00084A1B79|nr:hypothetical protein [Candidatus Marithrix sp. Canyon 246]